MEIGRIRFGSGSVKIFPKGSGSVWLSRIRATLVTTFTSIELQTIFLAPNMNRVSVIPDGQLYQAIHECRLQYKMTLSSLPKNCFLQWYWLIKWDFKISLWRIDYVKSVRANFDFRCHYDLFFCIGFVNLVENWENDQLYIHNVYKAFSQQFLHIWTSFENFDADKFTVLLFQIVWCERGSHYFWSQRAFTIFSIFSINLSYNGVKLKVSFLVNWMHSPKKL